MLPVVRQVLADWCAAGGQVVTRECETVLRLLTPPGLPPLCVLPGWAVSPEIRAALVSLCWMEYRRRQFGERVVVIEFRRGFELGARVAAHVGAAIGGYCALLHALT